MFAQSLFKTFDVFVIAVSTKFDSFTLSSTYSVMTPAFTSVYFFLCMWRDLNFEGDLFLLLYSRVSGRHMHSMDNKISF